MDVLGTPADHAAAIFSAAQGAIQYGRANGKKNFHSRDVKFAFICFGQHHVRGLAVAVHDAPLVCHRERGGDREMRRGADSGSRWGIMIGEGEAPGVIDQMTPIRTALPNHRLVASLPWPCSSGSCMAPRWGVWRRDDAVSHWRRVCGGRAPLGALAASCCPVCPVRFAMMCDNASARTAPAGIRLRHASARPAAQ